MTKKYGVVSSGILAAGGNNSFRHFRRGAVVELGDEEQQRFVAAAPQNFFELVDGFEWNETLAGDFLPGGAHFQVMFDVEAQKQFQLAALARAAGKPVSPVIEPAAAFATAKQKGKK